MNSQELKEAKKKMQLYRRSFVDWCQSDFGFYVPQRWNYRRKDWEQSPPGKGFPLELCEHDQRLFAWAFTLQEDGTLPIDSMWYIDCKKSGKTMKGAALAQWFGMFHERNSDLQIAANSEKQADVRVYQQLKWSLANSPHLHEIANVQEQKIEFYRTSNVARSIPSKASTQAGGNPVLVQVDEPWAFTTKADREFLDELAPSPTKKLSFRFFTSYPPFEGDQGPMVDVMEDFFDADGDPLPGVERVEGLEDLPVFVKEGTAVWWNRDALRYPWYDEQYLANRRADKALSPSSYARFYEVRMAPKEESFMPMALWDACTDQEHIALESNDRGELMVIGLDMMGGKRTSDCAAAICRGYDLQMNRLPLLHHRIWDPKIIDDDEFDYNQATEQYILDMHRRHRVIAVYYDPSFFVGSANRLKRMGVNMLECTQKNSRVVADTQYRNLIIGGRLRNYPQARDLRLHVSAAVARELGNGDIRIDKRLTTSRIDGCVADSMACMCAIDHRNEFEWRSRRRVKVNKQVQRDRWAGVYAGRAGK